MEQLPQRSEICKRLDKRFFQEMRLARFFPLLHYKSWACLDALISVIVCCRLFHQARFIFRKEVVTGVFGQA